MRILFLDLDTLRPDHLGCYGYHRNTSPNIDAIANDAVRYENYYCSDAPCLPSRTAMMTGRFGIHTGVVNHGGECAELRHIGSSRGFQDDLNRTTLPGIMREFSGMKTVSVSPFASRHSSWNFYAGFNEMHDTGKNGVESGEEITPDVLKWIDNNAEEDNWFLHVNYWDAHTPYRAPEEFGNPFENDPLPGWLTEEELEKHKKMVGPHGAHEINMYDDKEDPLYPRHPGSIKNMEDLRRMIDGYDCGIRYMDGEIGKLMKAFKEKGVADDLVVIITADHAENMGELGLYGEHATADYANCRIPMIIKWPGMTDEGGVNNALHYNLDLLPTIAEMLQIDYSYDKWDGQSYAKSITDGAECGHDYLVLSQCAHTCQRAVRFGDWIYLRTYHDFYHLYPKEMLFNIKDDPHERNNLAETHPEIVKDAVYKLYDWHDEMMQNSDSDTDPLWTVMKEGGPLHSRGNLKKYCKFLEQTGRAWAIPELRKKHPREFNI